MDAVGPLSPVIPWMTAGLLVCSLVLLLHKPLGMLFRLLLRSCAGLAALALLQNTGGLLGISLGVNPINALVLGTLGIPGFGLLLMLQWLLQI